MPFSVRTAPQQSRRRLTLENLIIQLISGAVGGNIGGALLKNLNMGTIGNTIAGLLGGAGGGSVLGPILGGALGSPMMGNVGSSGIGGIVLMVVGGLIKNMMAKK
jgi:uncharacterized membrane protein YeaQ/YmgE (transglycosylase-associated protein family)